MGSLQCVLNIGPGADISNIQCNNYFKRERQWDVFYYNTNRCTQNNSSADWCWMLFKNTAMDVEPCKSRNIACIDYDYACATLDESGCYTSNNCNDCVNNHHKKSPTRFAIDYEEKNT